MSDLVLNDETLRDILYRFIKDYTETTMSGGEHIVHNNNIDNLSKFDNIYVEKL